MQAITKVFSDIVKPYIDATDNGLINNDFVNGAVNMLPNTASSATVNGITFTVNDDGTVTANGTATAIAVLYIANGTWDSPKDIILSGCPNGGSVDTYALELAIYAQYDTGNGLEKSGVTVYNTRIRIASGYTANNLVFKPMITVADMPNSDYDHYVPYAMTNQQLTSENQTLKTLVVSVPSFSSLPQTISNASVTSDMVVVNSVLSNPSAQTGDWTVTTSNGSLTISGSISGSTTATLDLMRSR